MLRPLFVFLVTTLTCFAEEPLLKDQDRIALIGNTFIERSQRYGHLESSILMGSEAKDLTIRNLGWSGDSVFNDSRSYFGPPSEGRERLAKAVSDLQPNVVFICYGTGAAMSVGQAWTAETGPKTHTTGVGLEAGREVFIQGYKQLIKNVKDAAPKSIRKIILVTPPPLENIGEPLPDQIENNQNLRQFSKAIKDLAAEHGFPIIDLFESIGFSENVAKPPLTENGVHYGEAGYQMISQHWIEQMGYKIPATDTDELTSVIIEKNRLFFHRWRPANETYLFLFRKHEQGNNAKEIPMFDPLILEKEKQIEAIRNQLKKGTNRV